MNDLNQRSSLDEVTRGNSNSYFSDDILLDSRDSTSNYLDDLASVGNNWNNQQNFAGLVEPGDQETTASMEGNNRDLAWICLFHKHLLIQSPEY